MELSETSITELAEREIYTVSELTRAVKFVLEENFHDIWVEGEISNFKVSNSGHAYFTLKDEESQLRVVLFRLNKRLLKFEPDDGLHVIVRGRISVYEARGEYQLIADYMEPKGIGALQLAFEQLKEKLFKEGLFDEAHKKPIPDFPNKIAIVTSPTGAAIRDILRIIGRRFPNVHIIIYPVMVQGEGAAEGIAMAIAELNGLSDIDVMIKITEYDPATISQIYDIVFEINLEYDTFISTTIFSNKEIEEGPMAESPIYKIICKEGIPV